MGNSIWISSTERFVVESLLKHVHKGNRTETGFKETVWPAIVAELNTKNADELSKPITTIQEKNREAIVSTLIQVNAICLDHM